MEAGHGRGWSVETSRIQAVSDVVMEGRVGLEDELRWFYSQVAQLEEAPDSVDATGQVCFRSAHMHVRICLVERPRIDLMVRRLTIAVDSLAAASELLEERRVRYERLHGLLFTERRLVTRDPAGHVVELKQGWPFGPV